MEPIKTVGVIGMGYVGIPSAILFATKYEKVYGFQRHSEDSGYKINLLNSGQYPLRGDEPEITELLNQVLPRFECTSDYSKLAVCDAITIDVQTPIGDTTALMTAVMSISKYARPGTLIVIESTVPPGTTKAMKELLKDFMVAHAPERVTPGRLIRNLREHDRVVGGVDEWDTARAIELYTPILTVGKIIPMTSTAAEVTKTAENAFRDLQIAAVNQLAMYCENLGVNIWDVRQGIDSLKGEGITRAILQPGAGVGGHCLPKDSYYLVNNVRSDVPSLFTLARKINDFMPVHMYELLMSVLKEVPYPKVAILGWAFAPNTGDFRNTPSAIFKALLVQNNIEVSAHDPYVWEDTTLESVVNQADAVVIFTAHNEYKHLDPKWLRALMNFPIIIDGRNVIDPEEFIEAGFIYRGIGRGDLNG